MKADYLFISPSGPDNLLSLMVTCMFNSLLPFVSFFLHHFTSFGFISAMQTQLICLFSSFILILSVFFLFVCFVAFFLSPLLFSVPSSSCLTDQVAAVGHGGARAISQLNPKLHQRLGRGCRSLRHHK